MDVYMNRILVVVFIHLLLFSRKYLFIYFFFRYLFIYLLTILG